MGSGEWRVASGEKTKSGSLTAVRQKQATGFGMTSLRKDRRRMEHPCGDCPFTLSLEGSPHFARRGRPSRLHLSMCCR
jgi:hypothetical protein